MDRSIDQGEAPTGPEPLFPPARDARLTVLVGLGAVLAMLALYQLSRPGWQMIYNHFIWQASAWLEGQANIRFPVVDTVAGLRNDYLQDVWALAGPDGQPTGRGVIPFPPLPALVLLPFVAVYGFATDQVLLSAIIGAIDVGLAFWLLGRLPIRPWVRLTATVFLGSGTVLWYAASLGSTWFFAHVVAVGPALAAIAIALGADGGGRDGPERAHRPLLDGRQVAAGFLLGLAATARLTVVFGLPFLVLVGGGGSWWRRGVSAAIGAAIPIAVLVVYTQLTTGQPFNPAYEQLYRYEVSAYPEFGYHGDWAATDPRYIPQNLGILLFSLPTFMPACDPGVPRLVWSAAGCGYVVPEALGMSLVLTSPAYLLALPALRRLGRDRVVAGAALAALAIAVVNLAHFSQGWVQFGYRFSLDYAPFLLVLTALGLERLADGPRSRAWSAVAIALVAASTAIQAWGIAWARTFSW